MDRGDRRHPLLLPTGAARYPGLLAAAAHPAPSLAVTVLVTALAAAAGAGTRTVAVAAVAVLSGQLSVGWSNDRLDAVRDRAAGRRDKPLARPGAPAAAVDAAIAAALATTVTASLLLGLRPGLLHLAAVGCAWAYNLRLKATVLSWLPYALAFGALPAVVTLALHPPRAPAWWALAAAAALGVVAHLMNALRDLDDDRATGVRNVTHLLGRRGSVLVATGLAVGASLLLVLGPPGAPSALTWAAYGVTAAAAVTAVATALRHGRHGFTAVLVIAAVDVALVVACGTSIAR